MGDKEDKVTNTETFIKKASKVHDNKFDYSLVEYTSSKDKVKIICPVHGIFEQVASSHTLGKTCNKCRYAKSRDTKESFIKKAIKVHGDKYTYDNVVYTKSKVKVAITCPAHGDFLQTPSKHLVGDTCPSCGRDKSSSNTKEFIDKSLKLFGDSFSYNNTVYTKSKEPITLTCNIHGDFVTNPNYHLSSKYGACKKCHYDRVKESRLLSTEDFIVASEKIHNGKYSYDKSKYTGAKQKIIVTCPIHGDWSSAAGNHSYGIGCPSCGYSSSTKETEIFETLTSFGFNPISSDRRIIKPLELDIVIPEKKVAVEFNGVRFHTESYGRGKDYHKNKTDLCTKAGYRLIHIWEDDYLRNPERELNFLKHTLGCSNQEKVYARKTTIREIPKDVGRDFLDKHHVQGAGNGSVYLGTYHQEELVSVTSFVFKDKKTSAELTRHVNSKTVIGGLGKVTKYFSNKYMMDITSFCDLARFNGNSYRLAGFEEVKVIPPDYKYVVGTERQHKFGWRKSSIKVKLPEIYDENLTEKQMMELAEIPRIWDCGKIKFIYKYKNQRNK